MSKTMIIAIVIGVAVFVIGALLGYIKERKAMKYAKVENKKPEHKEFDFTNKEQ